MRVKTTFRKLPVAWPLVISLLPPALTRAETAVQAWAQRYPAAVPDWVDEAPVVVVDGSNNVIVTGAAADSGGYYDYATIKYSSAGVPLWTNLYNGPANKYDYPNAVAVDGSNNVIVAGLSVSTVGSYDSYDYATIKYSSSGVPLWTNRYDGPGLATFDFVNVVAVDGSNNVIVTGGVGSFAAYGTIKYSSAGVPLWTNFYGVPRTAAMAMSLDRSNNVIVTGYSTRGSGIYGNWDYATIKYSSAGVLLWTNHYNGPANGDDMALAVVVDSNNDVIVTGYSTGSGTGDDYATLKYSSAGVPLWTNRYNGPGNSGVRAKAVAVDGNNNVIVSGYSEGNGSSGDYATIKYSSTGVPLWTNRYNGPGNGYDEVRVVAVDGHNNVIVAGYSRGSGSYDYAMIGYSSDGVPLWTNRYNGPANAGDFAFDMALDQSGKVIVTGFSTGSGGTYDFATVKYEFPLMIAASRLTGGTVEMKVDNLQPGTLVIEASTNLSANPPDWLPVFTNTTPTNVLFYTDPDAATNPTRFYRAFQLP